MKKFNKRKYFMLLRNLIIKECFIEYNFFLLKEKQFNKINFYLNICRLIFIILNFSLKFLYSRFFFISNFVCNDNILKLRRFDFMDVKFIRFYSFGGYIYLKLVNKNFFITILDNNKNIILKLSKGLLGFKGERQKKNILSIKKLIKTTCFFLNFRQFLFKKSMILPIIRTLFKFGLKKNNFISKFSKYELVLNSYSKSRELRMFRKFLLKRSRVKRRVHKLYLTRKGKKFKAKFNFKFFKRMYRVFDHKFISKKSIYGMHNFFNRFFRSKFKKFRKLSLFKNKNYNVIYFRKVFVKGFFKSLWLRDGKITNFTKLFHYWWSKPLNKERPIKPKIALITRRQRIYFGLLKTWAFFRRFIEYWDWKKRGDIAWARYGKKASVNSKVSNLKVLGSRKKRKFIRDGKYRFPYLKRREIRSFKRFGFLNRKKFYKSLKKVYESVKFEKDKEKLSLFKIKHLRFLKSIYPISKFFLKNVFSKKTKKNYYETGNSFLVFGKSLKQVINHSVYFFFKRVSVMFFKMMKFKEFFNRYVLNFFVKFKIYYYHTKVKSKFLFTIYKSLMYRRRIDYSGKILIFNFSNKKMFAFKRLKVEVRSLRLKIQKLKKKIVPNFFLIFIKASLNFGFFFYRNILVQNIFIKKKIIFFNFRYIFIRRFNKIKLIIFVNEFKKTLFFNVMPKVCFLRKLKNNFK